MVTQLFATHFRLIIGLFKTVNMHFVLTYTTTNVKFNNQVSLLLELLVAQFKSIQDHCLNINFFGNSTTECFIIFKRKELRSIFYSQIMLCAIWHHVYNLRVLLLVKLQIYQCDFFSFFLTQALLNFVLCPSLIHSKLFSVNVIE